MAQGLPVFPSFNVTETAVDSRWKKWLGRLEIMLVGMDVKDAKRKRALLLHYAGEDVYDIFTTLPDVEETFDAAKQALTQYFAPKKSIEFEVYKFRQAKQEPHENLDSFHTRLRKLGEHCEFANTDKEIKSQIIQGCTSTRLRRKALRSEMSLDEIIKEARSLELSDKNASEIEQSANHNNSYNTCAIRQKRKPNHRQQRQSTNTYRQSQQKTRSCRNCGKEYPHMNGQCPAAGKICNFCKKMNHFEIVCRSKHKQSKPVHTLGTDNCSDSEISDNDKSSNEFAFGLAINSNKPDISCKRPTIKVKVEGHALKMLVDTGSSINVIDEKAYNAMKPKPKLNKTDTKVYAYGSIEAVKIMGQFQAMIETKDKFTTAMIYVTKGNSGNLLSYSTSVSLQVVPEIYSMTSKSEICDKFPKVFTGIGKLKDTQIELFVDNTVQPVVQPHRRIPFHLRKQVEIELKRLEDMDIIEKVDGPTDWVSPIVVAPKPKSKNNEIRICVDMRLPNEAIKRTRHIIPTIDDLIVDLNGSKIFSKLDLNQGYHQLEISKKSRNITTFTTHVGLRRYKRLNFGLTCASEVFQNAIRTSLEGLEGVQNISDDIIVYGSSQEQHDRRLAAALRRLQEKGLTLNKQKCEFNKKTLEFFGYIFSENGFSADKKKCEIIKNTPAPQNASEVRSFLAMTNYVSRFIPNYSTTTEPLRMLVKKDVKFVWEERQQNAFDKLKSDLSSETVMTYFDPKLTTQIVADASPVGIAAIMLQGGKVVSYASKSLTDTEKRYSQTEKENLAIVWAIEHWHIYLFGHKFTVITDAKALEHIYKNPKSKPPARLERWRMKMQAYDFDVIYKPGESNMSDYLSRHPDVTKTQASNAGKIAEEYLSFITYHDVPKAMTLHDIINETSSDNDLQQVMQNVRQSSWKSNYKTNTVLDTLARVKNELTVVTFKNGEVLLHGNRIVLPKQLQQKAISIAHEGHPGIVRTKQLLREKVYFPKMDKMVEDLCNSCIPCLAATDKNSREPLQMTEMPKQAWDSVSMDFCGPFPDGKYLLVLIDDFSRFPIVEIITSLNAKSVIEKLDKIFSEYGIPEVLRTDNGPPMNSADFQNFSKQFGFKHRKITPIWPQANGECERFMKTIGKVIRAAKTQKADWRTDMYAFVRNYRATKHATTKYSPAELLFGRQIRIKLPFAPSKPSKKNVQVKARENDAYQKAKMKSYADAKRHAKPATFNVGDSVLVKQHKTNKFSTPFDSQPYKITKINGSMITAKRGDKSITRNSSFFKLIRLQDSDSEDDFDDFYRPGTVRTDEQEPSQPRRSLRNRNPPERFQDFVQK